MWNQLKGRRFTLFIGLLALISTQTLAQNATPPDMGCLANSTYCQNGAACGVNGNCICQMFFTDIQCGTPIPAVTLNANTIKSGGIFVICFMYLVPFPFILYIVSDAFLTFRSG